MGLSSLDAFWIGLAVQIFGVMLLVAGTATPKWLIKGDEAKTEWTVIGLFRICDKNMLRCHEVPDSMVSDKWRASQTCGVMSYICGLFSCLVSARITLGEFLSRSHTTLVKAMVPILSSLGLILMVVTVVVFSPVEALEAPVYFDYRFGYSYALFVAGGVLLTVGAFVLQFGLLRTAALRVNTVDNRPRYGYLDASS